MRAITRRVHRLEEQLRPALGNRPIRIECGNLKTLPEDFTGPRHIVTVREPSPDSGALFEWEERPGAGPAEDANRLTNDTLIQVTYVEKGPLCT